MKAKYFFIITAGWVLALSSMFSCKKLDIKTATTSDVNIYDYLAQKPEQFSEFAKIIDKAGFSSFLNAYGAYTVFAPTNDAVKTFLQEVIAFTFLKSFLMMYRNLVLKEDILYHME